MVIKIYYNYIKILYYSCHNRNRDGMTNQKIKFVKKKFGVATIVIIGNYGKQKKRVRYTKTEIGDTEINYA